MSPVPASPDPESGPPARPATGRRRARRSRPSRSASLDDVRPGSLLVAMPALTDPTFAGTVVYVLDHSDTGTLGVVLGRPSQVEIRDVLPGWCDLAVEPGVFHVGGPVRDRHRAVPGRLPRRRPPAPDSPLRRVAGDVYLVDLDSDPADLTGASSPACASSPATRAGPPASWPARSPRAPGPACPARRTTSSARRRARSCGARSWAGRPGRLAVLSTAPADPSAN